MSFKNIDQKPEIKYLEDKDNPKIVFTPKILAIMKYIVDNVNDEVGWLGSVEVKDSIYYITDIYLPKQEVNGGTCELAPEGMQDLAQWMMANGHEDKIDKVHFWGHSHVNMGVTPSHQDCQQSEEKLRDFGGTFFIRAICNKAGLMSIAFYDGVNKRIIENAVWYIQDGIDRKEIADTYGPLVNENVKKMTYTTPGVTQYTPPFERRWDNDGYKDYSHYGRKGGRLSEEFSKKAKKTEVSLKGAA